MSVFSAKTQTGHDLPAIITPDGKIRLLASIPGERSYKATPFAAANPIIPRSDWIEIDRHRAEIPIIDQKSEGSCVAHGWTSMVERARSAAGEGFVQLSRAMLYAFVNGGRDAGANPADAAEVVNRIGLCTEATVPYRFLVKSQIPAAAIAEAARFRVDDGSIFECNSFDELVSAELQGFKTGMTVYVAGDWTHIDANGCPPAYRGTGNHFMSCDSRIRRAPNGEWLLGAIQSWGTGVWNRGLGYFREAHVDNQPGFQGYAIRWSGQDPLDPNLAPVA